MGLSSSHLLEHPFCAMPVSILQWCAKTGIFNTKLVKYPFKSKYWTNIYSQNLNKYYTICYMFLLFLICAGDIELNPGSRKNITSFNFFLPCTFYSIEVHSFSKLSSQEAYKNVKQVNKYTSKKKVNILCA